MRTTSSVELRNESVAVRHSVQRNGKPLAIEIGHQNPAMSPDATAMSIMLLVNRGQLSLDDDVRKYMPEPSTVIETT